MNDVHYHRRNLPHYYRPKSTYFITFSLKGSIPQVKLNELRNRSEFNIDFKTKEEKYKNYEKYFEEYDKLLDYNKKIQYLKNPEVAEIVKNSFHYYDRKEYKLICYTIMPNHVHVVFHLLDLTQAGKPAIQNATQNRKAVLQNVTQPFQAEKEHVSTIMQSIKGFSAREANKILNRKGSFWQSESYDHIVRDEDELGKIIKYVIYNPVKANLVEKWEDWKYSYLADE